MDRKDKQKRYWQDYSLRKRRVTVVLERSDYHALRRRAGGQRSAGRQLWLEAQAYREDRYLPSAIIETRLVELCRLMRALHDQLVTHQSSILGKVQSLPLIVQGLRGLHFALERFLQRSG